MEARGRRLFWVLLALAGSAASVLALDPGTRANRSAAREAFQRLVGGLGLGLALDLKGCACGFDIRLSGGCGAAVGPLPGGDCFCPRHGVSRYALPR